MGADCCDSLVHKASGDSQHPYNAPGLSGVSEEHILDPSYEASRAQSCISYLIFKTMHQLSRNINNYRQIEICQVPTLNPIGRELGELRS